MSVPLLDQPERRTFKVTEQIPRGLTVTEMLQWCIERDLDPDVVQLSGGGHLMWEREETDEERDKRLDYAQRALDRHVEWVAQQYAKYREEGVIPGD